MAATIADVAALAGVSRQTVSNTVNHPERVRPETRSGVQAAIDKLGFRANQHARRLRSSRSFTIGVRLERSRDPLAGVLLDSFLHALTERAAEIDHHILLFTADGDLDEARSIIDLQRSGAADAFVLTATHPGDLRPELLTEAGVRFVTFGRPWAQRGADQLVRATTRHAWVDVDGRSGTAAAVRALAERGCERIGYLGWPDGSGAGDERRAGWREAVLALGLMGEPTGGAGRSEAATGTVPGAVTGPATITAPAVFAEPATTPVPADHVARTATLTPVDSRTENTIEAAMAALPGLLEAGVDAIVCASDTLAIGAIAAMREAGVSMPVIGFDNSGLADALGFSSVDQHLTAVADAVIEALRSGHAETLIAPRLELRAGGRFGAPLAALAHP